ncbi:hypothetical protein LR48_Vigan03g076300 [Vigna angularis]|uniref:Uncharacterized protein n=1 Tax=Phaseolus angularis TaxID=3914 RepID=A0A0L9U3M1_PHAAN|nr:hypothetical protein LR48_Vigan03g076300 [Vigna angularis]
MSVVTEQSSHPTILTPTATTNTHGQTSLAFSSIAQPFITPYRTPLITVNHTKPRSPPILPSSLFTSSPSATTKAFTSDHHHHLYPDTLSHGQTAYHLHHPSHHLQTSLSHPTPHLQQQSLSIHQPPRIPVNQTRKHAHDGNLPFSAIQTQKQKVDKGDWESPLTAASKADGVAVGERIRWYLGFAADVQIARDGGEGGWVANRKGVHQRGDDDPWLAEGRSWL